MIRRDYILRMIAEFLQLLSRLRSLRKAKEWKAAAELLDQEFQRLIGTGAAGLAHLSTTDLLACVIKGESTLAVREKTLILATLLKEAGDVAMARENPSEAFVYHLKGMGLLLQVLNHEDFELFPEFVPRLDAFLQALSGVELPLSTKAMLMQHFEQSGQFGKAEDMLFSMLDDAPESGALHDLGISFYNRLGSRSDDQLIAGNLPREELLSGREQLAASAVTAHVRSGEPGR